MKQLPRYEQVKQELRELIGRGDHPPDQPFISQREVCARFGVSTTTAVKALNDLVAEGILVRQQGRGTFVAQRPAPPRESGRARTVACVIHGQGPVMSGVIAGVESVCAELDLQMTLSDSKGSPEIQDRALARAIDAGVSGVVLYPADGAGVSPALSELLRRDIPLVLVDRYLPDVATDAVVVDNFAVGFELTNYLVEQGHQRMATLWHEVDCTSVRERMNGHVQALTSQGLPVRPEFALLRPYQQLPEPDRLAILSGLLDDPEPPTVLICAHGFVVATVARDLAKLGIEVPGQVELAGMDDAGPYDLLPLTIAAASIPAEYLGWQAMHLLADRISDGAQPCRHRRIVVPISIRTRESAGAYLKVVSG